MGRTFGGCLIVLGGVLLFIGGMGLPLVLMNPGGGDPTHIALFALIGVTGAVLLIAALIFHRRTPATAGGSPGTGVRVGRYLPDALEACERNGVNYEVLYTSPKLGKNPRPSSLHVHVPLVTPTTLQFSHESRFDRLCKSFGIAREYQTGDAEFDAAIYVRCPSEEYAELYLTDADKRAAVLALRRLGYRNVHLTGTHARAEWPQFDPKANDHPELMAATADLLALLAKSPPAGDPGLATGRVDLRRLWAVALWAANLLYAATLVAAFAFPPIHTWPLVLAAAPVFVGGFVLFAWVSAYLLSGTSTAHDRWYPLMIGGLLWHGLGSVGAVAAMNALADTSPPVERTLPILDKRLHTSNGKQPSTTYYVSVPAWEPGGGTTEFTVSSGEYATATPGRSKLRVVTGEGRLGLEWLKSKAVQP